MWLNHCELILYKEEFTNNVKELLNCSVIVEKFVYILHDKDGVAPHYHIYIKFGSYKPSIKCVAELFRINELQVEKIKGRISDLLRFFLHAGEIQQNKHQYSMSELVANFDFKELIKKN